MPRLDLKGDARARKRIGKAIGALVALQARLRAPNGCPWDREQTHDSLRTYLLEETYEVLDALDTGDALKFADELGDLLLQIVFHAQLAAEAGKFDIADVIGRASCRERVKRSGAAVETRKEETKREGCREAEAV